MTASIAATIGGGGTTGGGATAGGGGGTGGGGTTGGGATAGVAGARPTGPGSPDAAVVRIHDVARVELGAQNYNQSCLFDGRPSVGLALYQLPGTNALDVADAVRKKMEELRSRFPDGVAYDVGYDTVPFVRESISDVVLTMFEAVALVGLVVLIFLQDWKAMVLPMIDVPVSIIGTFAVMAVVGFSLNNISLFGLVVTIGIVVDDAIVVLENIERMLARGYDIRTATIKAMEEVTGPIIAVAIVLCAVFVPCALIGGITGRFFRQFALTISVSTLISAINAVTMTPSRAVCFSRPRRRVRGTNYAGRPCRGGSSACSGGVMAVWWGAEWLAFRRHSGLSRPMVRRWPGSCAGPGSGGFSSGKRRSMFAVGAVAGGAVGWAVIRPVNAVLGWAFRELQSRFRLDSGNLRRAVGDCSASAWWCWRPTAGCWP